MSGRIGRLLVAGMVTVAAAQGWAVVSASAAPAAKTTFYVTPTGVSCTSSNHCLAVGNSFPFGGSKTTPWAKTWNGSSWRSSVAGLSAKGLPTAVSCVSSKHCVAIADVSGAAPLAETWNGKRWTTAKLPYPAGSLPVMESVSCPSSSNCLAVGYAATDNGADSAPLADWLSAKHWTQTDAPSPPGSADTLLEGVSCSSVSSCVAVGFDTGDPAGDIEASALSWNGTAWESKTVPQPAGSKQSALGSVSCISAKHCMATGYYSKAAGAGARKVLTESWNGRTWKITTAPNPHTNSGLSSVSCVSSKDCQAVGSWAQEVYANTGWGIAESWNGKAWKLDTVARPKSVKGYGSSLDFISCVSSTRCLALGQYVPGKAAAALAEAWNGKTWRIVRAP